LFNWYASQKKINILNPVKGIKLFPIKSRNRIMTEEEEELFFTKGEPLPHIRNSVIAALYTGMRRGEIFKLHVKDVFLSDIGGYLLVKDTKNGEDRTVPLNKDMAEFMRRMIEGKEKDDLVFQDKQLKGIRDYKKGFKGACKRAGIEGLNFHDLRHTFCTRAASRGINPFFIMKIVGHKNVATAKGYNNPTDKHLLGAMPVMESHQNSQQGETGQQKKHSAIG